MEDTAMEDKTMARRPVRIFLAVVGPALVLLGLFAYGIVFHLGFFNFFLSTGLSLWLLGLLWRPSRAKGLIAIPLAFLTLLAHPVPLLWAAAILLYLRASAVVAGPWRAALPSVGLLTLACVRLFLERFPHRWSWDQAASLDGVASLTAAEQVWLFDDKYLLIAAGLAGVLLILLLDRLDRAETVAALRVALEEEARGEALPARHALDEMRREQSRRDD